MDPDSLNGFPRRLVSGILGTQVIAEVGKRRKLADAAGVPGRGLNDSAKDIVLALPQAAVFRT